MNIHILNKLTGAKSQHDSLRQKDIITHNSVKGGRLYSRFAFGIVTLLVQSTHFEITGILTGKRLVIDFACLRIHVLIGEYK